eukprot:Skav202317  [mRNA]  locus=scaffold60:243323:246513:+ [translate_table: standard]
MSPTGGYGGSPADASLGQRFSEAIAAHSRDTRSLPSRELSEAGPGGKHSWCLASWGASLAFSRGRGARRYRELFYANGIEQLYHRLYRTEVVQNLWGTGTAPELELQQLQLGGVAILDQTVDLDVISRAREELAELETKGQVTASKDPCSWADVAMGGR